MFPPVLGETLVVVSDAHLGYAPPSVEAALLEFLDAVPSLGDALLVNGDLFEFWFAYATALPRHAFRVAAALVAAGTEVAAGAGVLVVFEHAASKPNTNRAIVNRTNVFIINPFHQRRI